MQSLRHSIRDRLRAIECPSDVIDQIGGWATEGAGQDYVERYELKVCMKWIEFYFGLISPSLNEPIDLSQR